MKREIKVTQIIEVEVDEEKFDEIFLEEFRSSFFNFENVEEHIKYLAELFAKGIISGHSKEFIPGYGEATDMGIKFEPIRLDAEILED